MKVRITVDLDADTRRAIAYRYSDELNLVAPHEVCERHLWGCVRANLEVLVAEYEQAKQEGR